MSSAADSRAVWDAWEAAQSAGSVAAEPERHPLYDAPDFDEWLEAHRPTVITVESEEIAFQARAAMAVARVRQNGGAAQPARERRPGPELHPDDVAARVLLPKEPPPPVVAADEEGRPLLRGGQVVWLYGQPKSGKSWATLALARAAAGRSLLICFERADETRYRLHGLFDADKRLRKRVGVLGRPASADFPVLADWLDDGGAGSLVVIDAASSSGCPIDGANVEPWLLEILEPWRDPDRTIVVVDHTPRRDAQAGRNAGAIGSQTKTAAADVQYRMAASEHDPVGRLVAATLADTGSNAMWHPRAIGLTVKRGVPTATAQEPARLVSEEEAFRGIEDGTYPTVAAAARACGVKRTTFERHREKWVGS